MAWMACPTAGTRQSHYHLHLLDCFYREKDGTYQGLGAGAVADNVHFVSPTGGFFAHPDQSKVFLICVSR